MEVFEFLRSDLIKTITHLMFENVEDDILIYMYITNYTFTFLLCRFNDTLFRMRALLSDHR